MGRERRSLRSPSGRLTAQPPLERMFCVIQAAVMRGWQGSPDERPEIRDASALCDAMWAGKDVVHRRLSNCLETGASSPASALL